MRVVSEIRCMRLMGEIFKSVQKIIQSTLTEVVEKSILGCALVVESVIGVTVDLLPSMDRVI